jgi:hypothetical protein
VYPKSHIHSFYELHAMWLGRHGGTLFLGCDTKSGPLNHASTHQYRGIYRIYPNFIKANRRMSTCNRLDLQTLGSQPIKPKNLPDHWSPHFHLKATNEQTRSFGEKGLWERLWGCMRLGWMAVVHVVKQNLHTFLIAAWGGIRSLCLM